MAKRKSNVAKAWKAARAHDEALANDAFAQQLETAQTAHNASAVHRQAALLKPYTPPPGVVPEGIALPHRQAEAPSPFSASSAPSSSSETPQGEHVSHRFMPFPLMGEDHASSLFGAAAQGASQPEGQMFAEGIGFPGYSYLSALSLRGEYRNIVETISREITRKWGCFKTRNGDDPQKQDKLAQLHRACAQFKIRHLFHEMVRYDGYFGVGHLFIDVGNHTDSAELATPLLLDKAKITKGSIRAFRAVEPMWCTPHSYESANPIDPWYYKPQLWWVQATAIHTTRLMQLISRPLPDILKPAYNFGGLPLTLMAKPYVDNFLRTRQSVSDLVHSFSVMALKTDLSQKGSGVRSRAGALRQRARLFTTLRDNMGLMLLDNSEELQNISTPLGALDKLQAQSQEHIASIANIPLVKFTGMTPSGLNASSDGELRVFYDTMAALRESLLSPAMEHIARLLMLHLWGEIDEDIHFVWDPLFELNTLEKTQVEKTQADIAHTYVNAGITTAEEERQRLRLEMGSPYNGLHLGPLPPSRA